MKTKAFRITLAAGTIASALLTGCIAVTNYSYVNAPPTPVKFETPQAEQTFYDAILAKYFPDDGAKGMIVMEVPFLDMHSQQTRKSSTAIFNAEVAAADTNHDGTITEAEAATYAAAISARTKKQMEEDARSTGW